MQVPLGGGGGGRWSSGSKAAKSRKAEDATKPDSTNPEAKSYTVYVERGPNGVAYCGMTCNLGRRAAEHFRSGRVIEEVRGGMTKSAARGLEQAMIEQYGLSNLSNKINSIARSNVRYNELVAAGRSLVRALGMGP